MKNLLLILVLSLNFYTMEAQKHSQSTTFSETDTSKITIENKEVTAKQTNAIIAKYESNIASSDTFKEVLLIIEQKLGKPSKNKKRVLTWKNDTEESDHYLIFLKEDSILIDYSGTREKSINRKNIIKLIEEIDKKTKLN